MIDSPTFFSRKLLLLGIYNWEKVALQSGAALVSGKGGQLIPPIFFFITYEVFFEKNIYEPMCRILYFKIFMCKSLYFISNLKN